MTDAATPNPVRVNLTDRLPAKISPSRMKDFTQCPKLFYYKTLLGLRDPATIHTAVGVLAHYALEMIFDHPRDDRNPKNAIPYVRVHWDEIRTKPDYAVLEEELGADGVEEMLVKAEGHVERYFDIERAWNFDPEAREEYLSEKVGDATVHGFIDRLDRVGEGDRERVLISDYKTGKVPQTRFLEETFFAMNVYALLIYKRDGIIPSDLRLIYTVNGSKDDIRRQPVNAATIAATEQKVKAIWNGMKRNASAGEFPTRETVLCGWCSFEDICPAKNPHLADIPVLDRNDEPMPR